MSKLTSIERIEHKIYFIRGHKVMLDRDLAQLYGIKTFVLNQAVRRNKERFPPDFMFMLTREEEHFLRSQFVILESDSETATESKRGKHTKYLPYVFTEQGVAMLSSVLRSKRAIQVNIQIMRTFVRLKQILFRHKELEQKIETLEKSFDKYKHENSREIQLIFEAIKRLMALPQKTSKRIGFLVDR